MIKKILNSSLLLFAAVAVIWIVAYALAESKQPVRDKGLEAAIRLTLQQPKGNLESHLLRNIRSLDAREMEIHSLEGIEALTGLETLNLRDNRIADLTPLASLKGLKSLNLRGNLVTDLTPLAELPLLEDLNLRENYIRSLEPLAEFELLRSRLYLEGNPVADFSPIVSYYHEIADTDIETLPPLFSVPGGKYAEAFLLALSTPYEDSDIYYTTDGSEPTRQSQLYTEPIRITARKGEANQISQIVTTPNGFNRPAEVHKSTVIRATVFRDELQPSQSFTQTYFVEPIDSSLAVISISTDKANLFDPNFGIYVPGVNYRDVGQPWEHEGNYTQRGAEWERVANMEFYEPDGTLGFSHQVGLRIHGGATRTNPLKSLRIYAKNGYGAANILYPVFGEESKTSYKRLLLRASGNDHDGAYIRDAFMTRLVEHTELDTQAYRPVLVYINGEYWGIHDLRERIDDHYFATHYGVDPQKIDLLSANAEIEEGSDAHYKEMIDYIRLNGVAEEEHYRHIQTMMDTDNFILYEAANIYFNNTDWPGNNIKFWREQTSYNPAAPYGRDGRWRWIMFDTDFGFNLYGHDHYKNDTISFATRANGPDWPNPDWSTFLLRELLKNEEFRDDFLNRMADLMNVEFKPERVLKTLDEMAGGIAGDMDDHIARWGRPYSMDSWNENLNNIRTFARERPMYMMAHLVRYFGLSSGVDVTVIQSGAGKGTVQVNSIKLPEEEESWRGYYFKGVPIKLTAVPKPGHRFVRWTGSVESSEPELTVAPEEAKEIRAVFE